MKKTALTLTTINPVNACLKSLASGVQKTGWSFYIAGDTKSPPDFHLEGADFLNIKEQEKTFPEFSAILPTRHYCRKNIAYLKAIADGVEEIVETDDDNFPEDTFWDSRPELIQVDELEHASGWVNVYGLFSDTGIWPRGFPLERLQDPESISIHEGGRSRGLIIQGLADDNPDVDAIYRLTRPLPLKFSKRPRPVAPLPGNWCPFNSQNTVFRKQAFPLLYLPAYCSFRMTDIWRSFVAQYCLWALNESVVFTNATVYQERNEHDLLRDFEDEVPGYLGNAKIVSALERTRVDEADLSGSLVRCYENLVAGAFVGSDELPLVNAWAKICDRLLR